MTIDLFLKISPVYIYIFLGFIAGKFLHISPTDIAKLLLNIIVPIVFLNFVAKANLTPETLSMPILLYFLAIIISMIFYNLSIKTLKDNRANIIAISSGIANAGYFGIPIAITLLEGEMVAIYVLSFMGLNFFESSFGYYYAHKANFNTLTAIKKVVRVPMFISLIIGLLINISFDYNPPSYLDSLFDNLTGAYAVLGMMTIGLGISKINLLKIDKKFLIIAFLSKFIAWPAMVISIILIDRSFFNFYSVKEYEILFLVSIMPMAASTVSIAQFFKIAPEAAANAVFLSTLFVLIYIPIMLKLFVLLV